MPRRSRTVTTTAPSPTDDLLLPVSGPNATPPERMTPRERREEIITILARGLLRRAHGIPPFTRSAVSVPTG